MLKENDVVLHLRNWLSSNGYNVLSHCLDTAPGHDIEAVSPSGRKIFIECKGGISPTTGRPFDDNYTWTCVSSAFFKMVRHMELEPNCDAGIAFPHTERYKDLMNGMESFCARIGLRVFWIDDSGKVSE